MDLNKVYADYYDRTHPPAYKIACDDSRQRFEDYQKERERKLKQDQLTHAILEKEKEKQNPQPTLT